MRSLLALLTLTGPLLAAAASAQVRVLPYAGYNAGAGVDFARWNEDGEVAGRGSFLVGFGMELDVLPRARPIVVRLRPSFERSLVPEQAFVSGGVNFNSGQRRTQAGLDLTAERPLSRAPLSVVGGVGAAYVAYQAEIATGRFDRTENGRALGANVVAGARVGRGFVTALVQGRYTLAAVRFAENAPEAFPAGAFGGGLSVLAGLSVNLADVP